MLWRCVSKVKVGVGALSRVVADISLLDVLPWTGDRWMGRSEVSCA